MIESASSMPSPTTVRWTVTAPSPAVTARLAVAVIIVVPPASTSMGSALSVTTSVVSTTITGNVSSATFDTVCVGMSEDDAILAVPVTVILASPAFSALIVTASPDADALA